MEEILYYTMLFDLYGELLTSKQQDYFKDYYFNNLSLSEIAENYEITRNAIHNQLREAKDKLEHYDKVLQLSTKQEKIKEICNKISDDNIKKELKDLFNLWKKIDLVLFIMLY